MNDQIDDTGAPIAFPSPDGFDAEWKLFGTDEAVTKMFEALALAQGEFEVVKADTTGRDGNREFPYADWSSLRRASRAVLAKHRLAWSQWPVGSNGTLISILAGHGARIHTTIRFDRPENIKQFGGALTYLSRYVYRAVFCLPGDDDPDTHNETTPNPRGQRVQPSQPKTERKPESKAQPKPPGDSQAHAQPSANPGEPSGHAESRGSAPAAQTHASGPPDASARPGSVDNPIDLTPATPQTLDLQRKTIVKLFSPTGRRDDIPLAVRSAVFRLSTGQVFDTGNARTLATEANLQKMIDWMWAFAQEHGVDPDNAVSAKDVETLTEALSKRAGVR